MQMGRILSVVFGLLGIVIVLTLGLNIQTANASIQTANQTNLIGLSVLDDWGAPLIILSLLALSGLFVAGGIAGTKSSGMKDLLIIVGASVVSIVGLSLMPSVITASNNLIGAVATDAEDVIWKILPLLAYIAVIGVSGIATYKTYRSGRKAKSAGLY